jgi:uncharacterized protein
MKLFLSYARADKPEVAKLVKSLEGAGIFVWWDQHLVPGEEFREEIQAQLDGADKVLVIWTKNSVQSAFVRDEANRGLQQKKLITIRLADIQAPLGFGELHMPDCSESYAPLFSALGLPVEDDPSPFGIGLSRTIRPTKMERLILINQYEILSVLAPSQARDHKVTLACLRAGYVDRLRIDEWLDDEIEPSIHKDVFNILELHRALVFSYEKLADKSQVDCTAIQFSGFDGNYESSYLGYAKHLLDVEGLYSESQNPGGYDAHWPMLPRYIAMLQKWCEFGEARQLGLEHIKAIASVGADPSHI